MKISSSYHKWLFIGLIALAVLLIGCERQAPAPDMTATPIGSPTATLPVLPTLTPTAVLSITVTTVPTNTVPTVLPPTVPSPEQPVPTATPGATGTEQVYTVQAGDNLFRIGLNYGCTVEQLSVFNNIPAPYIIYPGQQIRIPPNC
jgi:hypothetical protein